MDSCYALKFIWTVQLQIGIFDNIHISIIGFYYYQKSSVIVTLILTHHHLLVDLTLFF
jgi:hypothetical protein